MPSFNVGLVTTFVAQIAGAAVMTVLLAGFQREYRKSYLQHWTLGWAALALYHLAAVVGIMSALLGLHATTLLRMAAAAVAGMAGLAQIGWFTLGVQELVRRRPVRLREARNVLLVLASIGLLGAVFLITSPASSNRYFASVGLRALVGMVAFAACSVALFRARSRRAGMGITVLSTAFFVYALEHGRYLWLSLSGLSASVLRDSTLSLGYIDFLVQSVLAIGMIACLLEDEREATELASAEIEHLAYHDSLTGLPNRPLFIDRLIVTIAQAHRTKQKIGVFFLDLDRFKEINDSLGHSTGDQILRSAAERIRRCVREGDTVARFGGDEFTLLVPRIDSFEDAAKIAQKINDTLKVPFVINDQELFVSTSIGVSIYPTDGEDIETLLRNADAAMYRAKDSGRDNFQLYAPAMNARVLERLALENMLRKAITQGELELHYQPVVDIWTEEIIGFEALARWHHPELGMLLPAHFIPAAENSGLIVPIGEWVLNQACAQVKVWQKKLGRSFSVSVNLSARQFSQGQLVDQVRAALRQTDFAPSLLELEITESSAMLNAENTIHTLRELKKFGVRIAMDDFGTGFSSLNYLKHFPVDTLKLDHTFIHDVTTDDSAAAIVAAVIALSHDLSLKVVAEGVEHVEQLEFLRKHRCDLIQGFFFSRALDADEMEAHLITGRENRAVRRVETSPPAP